MAKTHLTSGERLQVYDAVFQLNQSFHLVVCRLFDLSKLSTFNAKTLADLRGLTQEVQVEINHHLLETITEVEHKDWHNFGKVRVQREKPKSKAKSHQGGTEPRRH
jgi:hypothetical protein